MSEFSQNTLVITAEIPLASSVPDSYGPGRPHVRLTHDLTTTERAYNFHVAFQAPDRHTDPYARGAVVRPYIGNDPARGMAENMVIVRGGEGKAATVPTEARAPLSTFWTAQGVKAAFYDDKTIAEINEQNKERCLEAELPLDEPTLIVVETEGPVITYNHTPIDRRFRRSVKRVYTVNPAALVLASLRSVLILERALSQDPLVLKPDPNALARVS